MNSLDITLFLVQLKPILSKPGLKKLVKHHNLVNVKTYLQLLKAFRLIRDAFFWLNFTNWKIKNSIIVIDDEHQNEKYIEES